MNRYETLPRNPDYPTSSYARDALSYARSVFGGPGDHPTRIRPAGKTPGGCPIWEVWQEPYEHRIIGRIVRTRGPA